MNPRLAGIAAALLVAGVVSGAESPGLPKWNEGGRANNQVAAGSPLTGHEPRTTVDLAVAATTPGEELPEKFRGGGADTARGGTTEFGKKTKTAEKKSSILEKLRPYSEMAVRFRIPAAVAAGLLAAGWLAGTCLRRRVRYRLPVMDVEPRLGGDYAAGVGAVISFASATVSLASQRDQL